MESPWETAIKPEVARDYADVGDSIMYPKFVVADRTDIQEAGRAVHEYKVLVSHCPFIPCSGWKKRRIQSQRPKKWLIFHGEGLEVHAQDYTSNP